MNMKTVLAVVLTFALGSCATTSPPATPDQVAQAAATITADDLVAHIKVLSSDDFEGRAPGTRGERLTVDYLVREFKALGASREPGRNLRAEGSAVGIPLQAHGGRAYAARARHRVEASTGLRGVQLRAQASRADSQLRRARLCRLRCYRARIQWDNFKGMDLSPARRSSSWSTTRRSPDPKDPAQLDSIDIQGQGDDVLRPVDLQVRDGAKLQGARRPRSSSTRPKPASYPWEVVENCGDARTRRETAWKQGRIWRSTHG